MNLKINKQEIHFNNILTIIQIKGLILLGNSFNRLNKVNFQKDNEFFQKTLNKKEKN
ncbi:unnamed protein product [Paramecium sonneborni]|uniref:Uncharacterized protein n=1 Tax=Paramecium sonneborni TaxID=65129 RepID=A0A8S1MN00_9CILI|nr:unnamed protein product [Paramecium sonneborni]